MTIASDLRKSIQEEQLAALHYRTRAKTADPVTARLYRHIAGEEDGHAHEFRQRLKIVERKR